MKNDQSAKDKDAKRKRKKLMMSKATIKDLSVPAAAAEHLKGGISVRGCYTTVNQ